MISLLLFILTLILSFIIIGAIVFIIAYCFNGMKYFNFWTLIIVWFVVLAIIR